MSEPVSKSPFWQFSIKFYAVPGVAEACIALQDHAKVDVNILFYLLWNATQGRAFNAADITEIEHRIGPWREMAVIPIRNIRRALKAPPPAMAPEAAEGLRTRIKAVELEAERLQQEALYGLAEFEPARTAGPLQGRGGQRQRQLLPGRHRPVPAGATSHRAFGVCKLRLGIRLTTRP